MRLGLLVLTLLISSLTHATVYKWTDEDGKVHFSDKPVKNAVIVEFNKKTENQVKLPSPTPSAPSTEPTADMISYNMQIDSPSEEQTIRSNEGRISLALKIKPKLALAHQLVLFMDGEQQGGTQQSSLFNVSGIDRGEHTFVIKALAQDGKLLASTPPRKVFLHRTIHKKAVTKKPKTQ
ncbi:DUF4124 domain-containing protein [Shewanella youngdeokensis]|uniref:DUF4124 domain-containing protein n=1 Tax=Shewanella youngdeokensis TaxID=2999068 RepID=A0ABZ0JXQ1_9GAMM|nr:DUF4124 domain-containing protein [Shewanella sp. DAU334]